MHIKIIGHHFFKVICSFTQTDKKKCKYVSTLSTMGTVNSWNKDFTFCIVVTPLFYIARINYTKLPSLKKTIHELWTSGLK